MHVCLLQIGPYRVLFLSMLHVQVYTVYNKWVARECGTTKSMSGQLKRQTMVAQGQLADSYPTYQLDFSFLSKHALIDICYITGVN